MSTTLIKSNVDELSMEVTARKVGKVESKFLRKKNLVPACLYGKDFQNTEISIHLKEASKLKIGQIVKVNFQNQSYRAVVKEIQKDYLKDKILHIDFLVLVMGRPVEIEVPLEIQGESQGVKKGGILQVLLDKLTIKVTPENIPEKIVVDVTDLDVGDSIHIYDLMNQLKDVKFLNRADTAIITVTSPEEEKEENLKTSS
ncbi:MAG: 50S ribosomal protein L25 [bacterium]